VPRPQGVIVHRVPPNWPDIEGHRTCRKDQGAANCALRRVEWRGCRVC
jgi:hypothetical protein